MNGVLFNNYLHKTWYIQIELILVDTELKRKLLICVILGHTAWVGWNSQYENYPNCTRYTPSSQRQEYLWSKPAQSPVSLLLTTEQLGKCMCQSYNSFTVYTGVSGGKISIITSSSEKQKMEFVEGLHGPLMFYSIWMLKQNTLAPHKGQRW